VRSDDASWVFHYAIRGAGLLVDRAGALPMPAGSAMLVRADDPYLSFGYPQGATERRDWVWCDFRGNAAIAMAASHVVRHGPVFTLTDRELSVAALADDLGVSREHLTRTFTQVAGVPPRRYIEELRLGQALQLLRETGLPIVAIAGQCGWRDAETFSSAFRRAYGCTPGVWRLQSAG
jgi:AraC-like DNA-binding protein